MLSHRHIIVAAAVVTSLAVGPGLAVAAGTGTEGAPARPAAGAVPAKPAKSLDDIASAAFGTVRSPAEASVRQQSKAAKAQGAAAATANDSLAVDVSVFGTSAYGVQAVTLINSDTAPLDLVVDWGDGTSDRFNGVGTGVSAHDHVYASLGQYTVTVTVSDGNGEATTNGVTMATAGTEFTPYGPTRLLDTRDGTGAPAGRVQPWAETRVRVAGNAGIPAGVTAVALNLTVVDPTGGAGHIIAYPGDETRPETSNVNYTPGQTVPNLAIVPVGADGYVNLYNRGGAAVDLLADIAGYFTSSEAAGYTAVGPTRLVDTREGLGANRGQVPGWTSFPVQTAGRADIPSGVRAVALNVTVTDPQSDGHLTVYPGDRQAPSVSNLNFRRGQTIANSVIVPVDASGRIQVLNGAQGASDVIVDVVGYYGDGGSAYVPSSPARLADTRNVAGGSVSSQGYLYMGLGLEAPEFTGFVLNSTVTNTRTDGHLTVFPDPNSIDRYRDGTYVWPTKPNASTLNWKAGDTVPNLVQADPGANGIIDFWNASGGDTDLVVDLFGFYMNR
ncbi:PKD domain-containing protein [Kitasatospora purpeofusca]|uniref:PKD domain-containing protein n=1 Tax=Kitasatospora purpeofusca TaxID=67352 RepID=UPI002A59E268|nr:PKD domain-containing protein [Kitasatospora purpeofusca]MDY0814572.1 PKD domain-containing protein [Kitasatospora purpeofusca]